MGRLCVLLDLMARFNTLKEGPSPVYALYVAALMQEAFVLLMLETIRFKHSSLIKIHKLGNVNPIIYSV